MLEMLAVSDRSYRTRIWPGTASEFDDLLTPTAPEFVTMLPSLSEASSKLCLLRSTAWHAAQRQWGLQSPSRDAHLPPANMSERPFHGGPPPLGVMLDRHRAEEGGNKYAKHMMDVNNAVDKAHEAQRASRLLEQPCEALEGVGPASAALLAEFKVKTVRDLAEWRCA